MLGFYFRKLPYASLRRILQVYAGPTGLQPMPSRSVSKQPGLRSGQKWQQRPAEESHGRHVIFRLSDGFKG